MRVFVVQEITLVAIRTFEMEVPDDVIAAEKAQVAEGHGPFPLRTFIENAQSGTILNDSGESDAEWVGTDVQVHDHDCSSHTEYHEPITQWDF